MSADELIRLLMALAPIIKDLLDRFLSLHFLQPDDEHLPLGDSARVQVGVRQALHRVSAFVEKDERDIYQLFAPVFLALEEEVGGLARFVRVSEQRVPAEIAAAFNHIADQHHLAPFTPDLIVPAAEPVEQSIKAKKGKTSGSSKENSAEGAESAR